MRSLRPGDRCEDGYRDGAALFQRGKDGAASRHRQRVLDAARALLLSRGYGGATIEAIARRAGVSVQTVYNTVGGKAAVLKAVYDTMLAGDEPIPIMQRSVRSKTSGPPAPP